MEEEQSEAVRMWDHMLSNSQGGRFVLAITWHPSLSSSLLLGVLA